MKTTSKEALFETYPIGKAVATLAVPTILSSLVMVLYNLADTYFVGMLNNPIQNAAVALAAPVLLAFNAINNLFGVGSSSMMSRALGSRNQDLAKRSSAFGFYGALISGFIFAILCTIFQKPLLTLLGATAETATATKEYMFWTVTCGAAPAILNVVMAYMVRSEGAALHASVGTMSGCLLNVILDPIFILPFGFNMGAAGAGLATFLSNCAACLYFFVLIFARRKTTNVCVSPKKLTFQKDVVFGVFTVGIPAAIQNLLNVTGATLLNNMTASYGSNAIAAMGISQKINMIPMYIASGLSQGIMPFISYNYASKNIKRMRGALTFAVKISLTFLIVVAATFFFASESYISLFMKNEQIVAYGSRFLRGFSLALPLLSIDFLAVGVFQAVGMGKEALIFALLRKLALEIPALYILNKLFPLYGLPYAQPIAELVLATAAVIMLIRLFKKIEKETLENQYD